MNILMVLDHAFPSDLRVENEATSLIKAGHNLGLLTISDYENDETVIYKGIKLYKKSISKFRLNKMHGLAGMIPWMDRFLYKQISRILDYEKYDAIHFHDLYLFGAARLLKKKYNLFFIGDMHENYVEVIKDYKWANSFPNKVFISHRKWERKEIEWLAEMDKVITVSSGIVDRIISKGVEQDDVVLVPNTIHTTIFDEFEIDQEITEKFKDYFTLVYVGGFVSNRGLEHVIDGVARLKEEIPNLRLVLVGDGDYRNILEMKVQECNAHEIVHFEGWMDQKKIKSYLIASDIGLIPFKRTPQTDNSSSNKLFQYMYFELPILGTNCTSVKKLVENEKCGLIYETENVDEFIKCILKLYMNKRLREELGRNGKKSVINKHSWDVTTRDMISMYNKLENNL
tara:strand:- start:36852 stop:38048 length:1197 start_codon:yes stop_codon:yes gene_type:complete